MSHWILTKRAAPARASVPATCLVGLLAVLAPADTARGNEPEADNARVVARTATKPTDQVKRFPIDQPIPPGTLVVPHDAPLRPGTRLGCLRESHWCGVEIVGLLPTGQVKVQCPTRDGFDNVLFVREDLIIPRTVLIQLQRQSRADDACPRHWTDPESSQQVLASLLAINDSVVTLRTPDGKTLTRPIASLDPLDQRVVATERVRHETADPEINSID